MAIEVLKGVGVIVGGVDLSAYVIEVAINNGFVEHDGTVMTHTAEKVSGGLAKWDISMKVKQGYAGSEVHQTMRPLLNTDVAIVIRKTAASIRSGTNPEWQATAAFLSYAPIAGAVGKFQEPTLNFKNAGTAISELTTAT